MKNLPSKYNQLVLEKEKLMIYLQNNCSQSVAKRPNDIKVILSNFKSLVKPVPQN